MIKNYANDIDIELKVGKNIAKTTTIPDFNNCKESGRNSSTFPYVVVDELLLLLQFYSVRCHCLAIAITIVVCSMTALKMNKIAIFIFICIYIYILFCMYICIHMYVCI